MNNLLTNIIPPKHLNCKETSFDSLKAKQETQPKQRKKKQHPTEKKNLPT